MSNKVLGWMMAMVVLLSVASCGWKSNENSVAVARSKDTVSNNTSEEHLKSPIPAGAQALIAGYPDIIKEYSDNKIVFKDGTELIYDDGEKKDFETMLDNSDIEDMFAMVYEVRNPPEYLADAGRSRSDALFKKVYGGSEAAVRANLVNVDWFGEKVKFNRVNGAADSLRAVARELKSCPELRKYLKSSGSFYWRTVRGAKRQSAHSYGIAFDIGVEYSDYWLWKNKSATEISRIKYSNKFPCQLVEIFERHGFIWGGAWYHYDTMHFEFRPEILAFAHNR